jgi:glyoxylase-like metal-dependent hydrolase (beta-lactamase superfamily II)
MNFSKYQGIAVWQGIREMPWNRPFKMRVCLYIADGLLIDTGPSSLGYQSKEFFLHNPIEQIILTHIHEDHSGMAAWLQKRLDVPLYLHEASLAAAGTGAELPPYRVEIWGERPAFSALPIPEQISTGRYHFQVIDTPGHYVHHKAFLEREQGWLFSGDLLVNLRPRSVFAEEDANDMINSLQKLDRLDFKTIFCAHTGIFQDGRSLLRQKLDYLLELRNKVLSLRGRGWDDHQIDRHIFPEEDKVGLLTNGDFSSYYLINTL